MAPDPPELEILITSTGHDNITSWAESAEQDTRFMCVSNLGDALEGRIGVYHDRVGRIAVSGENLLSVRRPVECGDLRRRFQCVQACPSRAIPDVDGRIAGTTTRGQQRWLPRAPGQRLQKTRLVWSVLRIIMEPSMVP